MKTQTNKWKRVRVGEIRASKEGGVVNMSCEHCEQKSHSEHEHSSSVNWKAYALLAGAGILLVLSFVQALQIGNAQNAIAQGSPSLSLAATAPSSGGETYEEMMARMHPEQVQSAPSSAAAGSQMVGGC